jgi:hypothetical protein
MDLPVQYVVDKFYQYVGLPRHKRFQNVYEGCCPICREGKSWGKKRRCYYIPDKGLITCQNEQRVWNPIEWIKEVAGLTYYEILKEASEFDESISDIIKRKSGEVQKKANPYTLPHDSINLRDMLQVKYHANNQVVIDCLRYIQQRKLDKAINRPRTFYVSLTDRIHKNRLCIPFINKDGKITFYQTRAIYKQDEDPAKYLSKIGGDKTVFGANTIDESIDYIFIFEGPIDAMFVKNGIAIGGIEMTEIQEEELKPFRFHKRIWVLDNPFIDKTGKDKIAKLIDRGETVFIPSKEFREFKDMNELCVAHNVDHVGLGYMVKNSYEGLKAMIALKDL